MSEMELTQDVLDNYKSFMAAAEELRAQKQAAAEQARLEQEQAEQAELAAAWAGIRQAIRQQLPLALQANVIVDPVSTDIAWDTDMVESLSGHRINQLPGAWEQPGSTWEAILWLQDCSPIVLRFECNRTAAIDEHGTWVLQSCRVAEATGYFMQPYFVSGARWFVGLEQWVKEPGYTWGRYVYKPEQILSAVAAALESSRRLKQKTFQEWWAILEEEKRAQWSRAGKLMQRAGELKELLGVEITEEQLSAKAEQGVHWGAVDGWGEIVPNAIDPTNELVRAKALVELLELEQAKRNAQQPQLQLGLLLEQMVEQKLEERGY